MRKLFSILGLVLTCALAQAAAVNWTNYVPNLQVVTNANVQNAIGWTGGHVTYVPLSGDIQTYINSATAGDTLMLASGTYTITAPITVNKPLNIVGQGYSGFTTTPATSLHGTLIRSETASIVGFQINTNNVRIASISINLTGASAATGIVTTTNLVGISLHNIDVILNGPDLQQGFTIIGSDAVLRNLTFNVKSTDDTAIGMWTWNDSTCTNNTIVDCFNVTGTVQGANAAPFHYAHAFRVENLNVAKTITLNLDNSVCRALAGTPNDVAISVSSATTFNAICNSYLCTFDGADYDADVTAGDTLSLGGSVMVNNLINGTPTYRETMVANMVTVGPSGESYIRPNAPDGTPNFFFKTTADHTTGNIFEIWEHTDRVLAIDWAWMLYVPDITLTGDAYVQGTVRANNLVETNTATLNNVIATNITSYGSTNLQIGPKTTWLVFEGDSLTSGSGAYTEAWPYALTNSFLTNSFIVPKTNCAAVGETAATMLTQYAAQVQPMKPDASHDSLLFFWAGVNDLSSSDAATTWARLTNYWGTARADGFKVVAFTVTSSKNFGVTSRKERNTLNQLIRESDTLYDFLVDADAIFPTSANCTVDGVHFTNPAARYLAKCIMDVLSNSRLFSRVSKERSNSAGSFLDIASTTDTSTLYRNLAWSGRITGPNPFLIFEDEGTSDAFVIYPYGGSTSFMRHTSTGNIVAATDTVMTMATTAVTFPNQPIAPRKGIIDGATNVLVSATGKDFFWVSVPNTNGIGGKVFYTVFCTDGTDVQEITGDCKFAAVAKSTTVTPQVADVQCAAALTGGSTLTAAIAANVTTNNVFALGVTATTSLTTTNLVIKWRVETPSVFTVNAIP